MSKIYKYLLRTFRGASDKAVTLVDKAQMNENSFMIVMAVLIGVLAGFGAVLIRILIHEISFLCFPGTGSLLENIVAAPWYVKLLIPAIGGLLVGPMIYFFAPEAKGHGVPEVMQAILLKGGSIRSRVALVKALASSITIGTGGSVGREGPIIQIGSSIGSTVGQFFRVPSKRLKTLVGCGAAAGIAAAFNAPVAGALFALEIILMDFAVAQFSPIVVASVVATVISHMFEGNYPAFSISGYSLESPHEILFYFALGALSGIVSYLFIKVLYFFEDLWDKKIKIPPYVKPAIGGLLIGVIALYFPQIMGVGYDSISAALGGNMFWLLALALIFVKILATSITLGSGGSGGIFAPSLFMGAALGAFFGHFVHEAYPNLTAEPGAYAVVAMGGLVAGTTRAPLTAIIIVFEMTKDYNVILPLMITCVISMILSSKLSRESIYTLKLVERNIKIKGRAEVGIMKSILVGDIYSKRYEYVPENANFAEVVKTLISKKTPYLTVKSLNGKLMGVISIHQIKDLLFEKDSLKYVLIAGDIADKKVCRVTPENNCREALKKMKQCDYDGLPVVDPDDNEKQIGVVWRKDIDYAYQKEVDRTELTSDLASRIASENADDDVRFLEGYSISEIPAPASFAGRSIKELNIRSKYGVDVLSIKRSSKSGDIVKAIPKADYVFSKEDRIIVAGEMRDVNILKNIG